MLLHTHVPLLEESENFQAAIENNFFTTFNFCEIAYKNKVSNFVLISSDKAVNPPNLMEHKDLLSYLYKHLVI